jgi:hypothetical protein
LNIGNPIDFGIINEREDWKINSVWEELVEGKGRR